MPRTSLTVQDASRFTPVVLTMNAVDAVNGNRFTDTGEVAILVTNASGGDLTVTVKTPEVYDTDLAITDRTYTIATGASKWIGPFSPAYRSTVDSTANQVQLDWSTGTSVTVGLLKIVKAT